MPIANSPIADNARDELPETWDALLEAATFGEPALERRHDLVMYTTFGKVMDDTELQALSPITAAYTGKLLALDLIIPGIDFWSKQALAHSAGERETKAYKDRAEDLAKLRDLIFKDVARLRPLVEAELPLVPRRATDTARVANSGAVVGQDSFVTADPTIFEPLYGPPEDTTVQ
jgi:hypothetical protein